MALEVPFHMTSATLQLPRFSGAQHVQPIGQVGLILRVMQGSFAICIRVGSGDPVRVLCLFHNEYTGYN